MLLQTNRDMALAQYRLRARLYDAELAAFEPVCCLAVAYLQLQPGDTVLDIGCGTGLSLELLQQGVGPQENIVGIEQSPDMVGLARGRVARHNWRNVTLVNAPAESAVLGRWADAALFHFTHDILRHPGADGSAVFDDVSGRSGAALESFGSAGGRNAGSAFPDSWCFYCSRQVLT